MKPKDLIEQLFGPGTNVEDFSEEYVIVTDVKVGTEFYSSANVSWVNGTVQLYRDDDLMRTLAIEAKLVPIE